MPSPEATPSYRNVPQTSPNRKNIVRTRGAFCQPPPGDFSAAVKIPRSPRLALVVLLHDTGISCSAGSIFIHNTALSTSINTMGMSGIS